MTLSILAKTESQLSETYDCSIILPIYNEEELLQRSVSNLSAIAEELGISVELILCDDKSTDQTRKRIKEACENDGNVRSIFFQKRIGKGGTIRNALQYAKGSVVMMLDVDAPIKAKEMSEFIGYASNSSSFVIGVRGSRRSGITRHFLSIGFNTLVRILFRTGLKDHQCGMKAFQRSLGPALFSESRCDGLMFDTELIVYAKRMGINVKEVKVRWPELREPRSSKIVPLRVVFLFLVDLSLLRVKRLLNVNILRFKKVSSDRLIELDHGEQMPISGVIISTESQWTESLLNNMRRIYSLVSYGKP